MPYVSPKAVAQARSAAAVNDLASSLAKTSLESSQASQTSQASEPPSSGEQQQEGEKEPAPEATEASDSTEPSSDATIVPDEEPTTRAPPPGPTPLTARSHTPDAPSLASCGTDSSNSLHTLSSVGSDDDVEIIAPEDDVTLVHDVHDDWLPTPEMAQYHRDIVAFTKPLYDRAKMVLERKLRVQRARGIVC